MLPAIAPGDWLLVDPTITRWPRRGAIVLFREPDGEGLSIKRLVGGPGDVVPFAEGFLHLADDEAWLLADASAADAAAAGFGAPIDSRRFGPVTVDGLVGRIWFRYGPPGRPIGRVGRSAGAPDAEAKTGAAAVTGAAGAAPGGRPADAVAPGGPADGPVADDA